MSKRLVFEGEARAGILKGIELLGQAVETTYGYHGPCVMVQHRARGLPPVFTRDGVTVANALVLKDALAEIGARMLRDVANAVSRQAGDGTTTAVILARAIARDLLRSLAVGADPLRLRDGMETAVQLAIATLERQAEPAIGDRLAAVANISMRGEGSVAELMQQAYTELGTNGIVNVEASWTGIDRIEFNEGFRCEQGLLSPMLITDEVRRIAELENVRVLLYHGTVQDFMDLVPVLESVKDSGQSLALVCEGIDERPLQTLVMNVHRGVFQAIAAKPGLGDRTKSGRRLAGRPRVRPPGTRVLVPSTAGDRLEQAKPIWGTARVSTPTLTPRRSSTEPGIVHPSQPGFRACAARRTRSTRASGARLTDRQSPRSPRPPGKSCRARRTYRHGVRRRFQRGRDQGLPARRECPAFRTGRSGRRGPAGGGVALMRTQRREPSESG
ncbi:MAG: TCP-1/cpn60 chaperonin family protein [Methylotetracoccus sp.]